MKFLEPCLTHSIHSINNTFNEWGDQTSHVDRNKASKAPANAEWETRTVIPTMW